MERRTALITGSSRGIGRAIAVKLSNEGYNIVINYKDNALEAERTASLLAGRCIIKQADITKKEEVDKLYDAAKAAFGFVDTLVNNAGISRFKMLIDQTDEEYKEIMDTNFYGAFCVSRKFLPDMLSNRFGRIVNISSIWGIGGAAMESVYSASKAAVIGFTKALSKEVMPMGVTVNAIAPGAINTDMLKILPLSALDKIVAGTMAGRLGEPDDVAEAVAYFAQESAGFVSGQVVTVSGEYLNFIE